MPFIRIGPLAVVVVPGDEHPVQVRGNEKNDNDDEDDCHWVLGLRAADIASRTAFAINVDGLLLGRSYKDV
jgi:hypothetical protein